MNDAFRALGLAPARYSTNCRACAAPITFGQPALARSGTGGLTCAVCVQAERRPQPGTKRRPEAA